MPIPEFDRVLSADYLGDLKAHSIDEIRHMRAECQQVEDSLSYLRRLVQGRLEVVSADLRCREETGRPADPATLVKELPKILGDRVHAPGFGRPPGRLIPPDDDRITAELDAVLDAEGLASLGDRSDDQVRELADRLTELERRVSSDRRALHERLDALQGEVARRYKAGEVSVDSLLQ